MELEKQRISRRNHEIQQALSEIMWKGTSSLRNDGDDSNKKDYANYLEISPPNPKSKLQSESLYSTDYNKLADDHIIDYMEKPKTVPLLPYYLRSGNDNMSFQGNRSVSSSHSFRTSAIQRFKNAAPPISTSSSISLSKILNENGVKPSIRMLQTIRSSPPLGRVNTSPLKRSGGGDSSSGGIESFASFTTKDIAGIAFEAGELNMSSSGISYRYVSIDVYYSTGYVIYYELTCKVPKCMSCHSLKYMYVYAYVLMLMHFITLNIIIMIYAWYTYIIYTIYITFTSLPIL